LGPLKCHERGSVGSFEYVTKMRGATSLEEDYTARGDVSPFDMVVIKVDSDGAYRTAAEKSADYIKKSPDKPVMFLMELSRRFPRM
jgi:hypothetical protein